MTSHTHSRQRGGDALVRSLAAAGVHRIFTLSGNHIMPVFDAALDAGIALLHTRHEASTVHMADAFARVSGQLGIALVTGGPGHANAVSALYTAQMAEAPVVLLSGHAPHAQIGRGAFQEMRQAEMAEPVTKASWTCASAAGIADDIARAVRIARSGRPGPVHLSLPTDVLEHDAGSHVAPAAAFEPEATALAPDTAAALMRQLMQSRRPMILVGPACLTRSGRRLLAALEADSGIPVVGMESPRGVADPSLGAFAQVLAQADTLLLVGKRLDFTLAFGTAPFPAAAVVHQVDADAAELERTRRALGERLASAAHADALAAIEALTRAAPRPMGRGWLDEVRSAIAYRPAAWDAARAGQTDRLHPGADAQALAAPAGQPPRRRAGL